MTDTSGEWSYATFGTVRHWRERTSPSGTLSGLAICYVSPAYYSEWSGSGNHEEKRKLISLRPCKNCVKRGASDGELKLSDL